MSAKPSVATDLTKESAEKLSRMIRSNDPRACAAIEELERRLVDLKIFHRCARPLGHL